MEVLALILGLAIGGLVGTVGGGGAILALPVLVYVLDQGVSSRSTASLIVVTLGASVGAGAHAVHGHLCRRVAAAFALLAAATGSLERRRSGGRDDDGILRRRRRLPHRARADLAARPADSPGDLASLWA